jgi:hypothetical protein
VISQFKVLHIERLAIDRSGKTMSREGQRRAFDPTHLSECR